MVMDNEDLRKLSRQGGKKKRGITDEIAVMSF